MTSSPFYRAGWVFYLFLAIAGVLWIGWLRGVIPLALFVRPEHWWQDLGLGLAAGLALLALWVLAHFTLPLARELEANVAATVGPMRLSEALGLALLSGFSEELFFRGAVQEAFGWIPATLFFVLLHFGPGRPFRLFAVFAALAGLTFAALVEWRGTLLPAMLAHALINGVNLSRMARRSN